jgi:hypothetical protein
MPERRRLRGSERDVRMHAGRSGQDLRIDVFLSLRVNFHMGVRFFFCYAIVGCATIGCSASIENSGSSGDSGAPDGLFSGCNFVAALDQGCMMDSDCAVGIHQIDCCGSTIAIGFNHAERARFDTSEPTCVATLPACGCDPNATLTDSGEFAAIPAEVLVACVTAGPTRRCKTYVTMRPPDAP